MLDYFASDGGPAYLYPTLAIAPIYNFQAHSVGLGWVRSREARR